MQYFDELPIELQDVVRTWLEDHFTAYDKPVEFECRHRSGFSPHSWNKGGLHIHTYQRLSDFQFQTVIELDKEVKTKVNQCIESLVNDVKTTFKEKHADKIKELNIKDEQINWNDLDKLDLEDLYETIEDDLFNDDYSSTYHEIRVMFDGNRKFTVDVMFNYSDAPYFRGCNQCKTFEIETLGVKTLEKFLKKITKEVARYYPD